MDLRGTISNLPSQKRFGTIAIAERRGEAIVECAQSTGIFELKHGSETAYNSEIIDFNSGLLHAGIDTCIIKNKKSGRVCGVSALYTSKEQKDGFLFRSGQLEICLDTFYQLDLLEEAN